MGVSPFLVDGFLVGCPQHVVEGEDAAAHNLLDVGGVLEDVKVDDVNIFLYKT